eukprot:snap_masked-scaffold_43-processed-gene-1.89-mRNA-1 protein AED:1.00 eAED:1.00 QI:0/-1/0/0/-1/1/1/0/273
MLPRHNTMKSSMDRKEGMFTRDRSKLEPEISRSEFDWVVLQGTPSNTGTRFHGVQKKGHKSQGGVMANQLNEDSDSSHSSHNLHGSLVKKVESYSPSFGLFQEKDSNANLDLSAQGRYVGPSMRMRAAERSLGRVGELRGVNQFGTFNTIQISLSKTTLPEFDVAETRKEKELQDFLSLIKSKEKKKQEKSKGKKKGTVKKRRSRRKLKAMLKEKNTVNKKKTFTEKCIQRARKFLSFVKKHPRVVFVSHLLALLLGVYIGKQQLKPAVQTAV